MKMPNKDTEKYPCPTCDLDKFLGIALNRKKLTSVTITNCPTCEGKGYIIVDLKKGKIK